MIIFFTFIFLLRVVVSQSVPLENQGLISPKPSDNFRKIFWRASRFKRQYGGCSQSCCCTALCCCAQQFPPYLPPAIIPPSPAPLSPPIVPPPPAPLPPPIQPPSPCCQISQRICCQPSSIIQSPSTCCSSASQSMIPQQPIPASLPIPVLPLSPQIFPSAQMGRSTCCNCCPCFGRGRK